MTNSLSIPQERSSTSSLLIVFAIVTLGYVLQISNGTYLAEAIGPLMAVWVAMLVALTWRRPTKISVEAVAFACLCFQFILIAGAAPTDHLGNQPMSLLTEEPVRNLPFRQGVMLAALLAGLAFSEKSLLSKLWFPAIVVLHFAVGLYLLKLHPSPWVDVFTITKEAIGELLQGRSPYGFQAENIYGTDTLSYPQSAMVGDKLTFGYPYLPLPLLIAVPGALLGDLRYSMLVCMSLAALLIGYLRPGRLPKLAALLLLFTPKVFYILDKSWTDPSIVLATAAVAFVAVRARNWVWLPAGLFLAMKQQMFVGIPALLLLLPRQREPGFVPRLILKTGLVALATVVFFVLWDPHGFARSALDAREQYRMDSLSLVIHIAHLGVGFLSSWTWALVIIPVAAFGYWRAPRTVTGFALLNAALHSTIYVFGTHGFCNEHFNVIGSLAVALAAWQPSKLET